MSNFAQKWVNLFTVNKITHHEQNFVFFSRVKYWTRKNPKKSHVPSPYEQTRLDNVGNYPEYVHVSNRKR